MIDASIIGGLKPFQAESPVDNYAKMMTLQDLMQKSQLGQISLDDHRQSQAADNTLARLLAQGKSDEDISTGLASAGYGKQAMAYTKAQQDNAEGKAKIGHLTAQTGKLGAETLGLAIQQHRDQLGPVNDFPAAAAWVTAGYQNPVFASLVKAGGRTLDQTIAAIPQDAAGFQQWKMQSSLDADKLSKMLFPDANAQLTAKTSTDNNAATNTTSRLNNSATVGATLRGQDMTDARSRDTLEAGKQQIVQTDNGPVLVNTRTGAGRVVNGPDGQPLPGVTKPLNDSQSKALLFGSRMREADKVLATLSEEGKVNSFAGSRAPVVGGFVNAMSSDNNQMLNQAKTDFMTAVLRRESGAAISSGEFGTADKQYFPQINDGPGVIAQKAANRQLAIKGILMEVPEKHRGSLQSSAPAMPSGWSVKEH